MIVLVFGLPGSGKSYFSSRLAKKINAEYLISDIIRKELFPVRNYSESEKSEVYKALLKQAQEAGNRGRDVVIDATFYTNKIRVQFISNCVGKVNLIEVWADEKIIRDRLKTERPYSEADFKIYNLIKQHWEPCNLPHLKLKSTNDNINVMLERALNYLRDDKSTN